MNIPVTNGSRSPTWRWLAGVAVGILMAIGGYLYAQTQRRIERGEEEEILLYILAMIL